jgi:simple sugar transport system substrate-binding protein
MKPFGTRTRLPVAAALVTTALALAACSGGGAPAADNSGGGGGAGDNSGYRIAMITHAPPGDTFWDKIQQGAQQASKNNGITFTYSGDPDPAKQATLINTAVDSKVDGIAVSLATPDALKTAVQKARAAGIPVVAFNAGIDQYKEVGAQMFFGSDVIQAAGSVSLEARCAGVKKGVANTENLQVNGEDDSAVTSAIQAKLAQDKSIDYVMTLGAPVALDALKAKDSAGSSAKVATFDLNTDAAQDIKDGKIQFSIDQQPYVQGYDSVQALYLYKKNGNDVGGGKPVLTGPSFVDSTNIDTILPFTQKNTR